MIFYSVWLSGNISVVWKSRIWACEGAKIRTWERPSLCIRKNMCFSCPFLAFLPGNVFGKLCFRSIHWPMWRETLRRNRFANEMFWEKGVARAPAGQPTMFRRTLFWIFEMYSWVFSWACKFSKHEIDRFACTKYHFVSMSFLICFSNVWFGLR